jgi:hypothetical protein
MVVLLIAASGFGRRSWFGFVIVAIPAYKCH